MRPIAISLSPNTEREDILQAMKLLVSPWVNYGNSYIKNLEQWFRKYFGASYAVSFISGRAAFLAILKSLEIGAGSEVIIQAFTCAVVPDMIIAVGARPVFVDIDKSMNIDPHDLENKITNKTKAIVIQHTFGIPADLKKILDIAKKRKIFVIEDCAHTIGGKYKEKKLGTFGKASFFSFGRDKAFSSVFGGMAVTNDEKLGKKIRNFQKNLKEPFLFWTWRQILHPVAFSLILPLYNLYIGKIILIILQKLKLLSFPVSKKEKEGRIDTSFIKKNSNMLAYLALYQLKRLNRFNKNREEIGKIYINNLNEQNCLIPYDNSAFFLRFPVLTEKRDIILKTFREKGVYLGKWYSNVIDPEGIILNNFFYERESCPNAEFIAKRILNLPTYPTFKKEDAKKIVSLLNNYVAS